ncbi:MAG: UTP--glucose-1-phosphate uridylyltransferase [Bauldia sp.]|nr:UTP--glucose-1-phosphate uridylyltransferase [Bauldia sp.]
MPEAVRIAVFPVAGLGTRFLPATKTIPKEMLPVVDRPLIQYAVDEAREAGIEHFVFVTGRNKSVIEDYFDIQYELEATLDARNKHKEVEKLHNDKLPPGAASFTRQQIPAGLGHAVWCAKEIVGGRPFAVILPDMLLQSDPGCLAQMVEAHREVGGNILALSECDPDKTNQYGIVALGEKVGPTNRITAMVEKPKPSEAPSNLYINGRYIFQPQLFEELDDHTTGAGGEIQLTDAMIRLARRQPIYGLRYAGRTFDCGSKGGFLAANYAYALKRPDIADELRSEFGKLLGSMAG